MSIYSYQGLPGSGKSFGVVKYSIVPALEAGRMVVTNIPLQKLEVYKKFPKAKIKDIDLTDFAIENPERLKFQDEVPPGALLVIDELWRLWPAGIKANGIPEDHKSFLAEHRHRVAADGKSTEICFVTQDSAQLASFCRRLIEKTFIAVKTDAIGIRNRARVDIYQGNVTGMMGTKSQFLQSTVMKYTNDVTCLYKSHTQSQAADGVVVDETSGDKRTLIWRNPVVIFGIVCAFFIVPYSFTKLFSMFSAESLSGVDKAQTDPVHVRTFMAAETASQAATHAVVSAPRPTPNPMEQVVTEQAKYRLAGVIGDFATGTGFAFVEKSNGRQVRIPLSFCEPGVVDIMCRYMGAEVTFDTGPWPPKSEPRSLVSSIVEPVSQKPGA